MKDCKCKFSTVDILRIIDLLDARVSYLQNKEKHEMSEITVYRIFSIYALLKRFRAKSYMAHPADEFKMSFDMKEVLTLKFVLMDHLSTPGLSKIFMLLDKKIHPAIQLEL